MAQIVTTINQLRCCNIGESLSSITRSVKEDNKYATDLKTIIHTNSKRSALGLISDAMEGMLEVSSENDGEVIPMTGDDGIQFKVFPMHAFSHDSNQINQNDFFEGESLSSLIPNLWIMPATKVANCGVSSRFCRHLYWNGIAPLYYSSVQEMGCVDQIPIGNHPRDLDNRYKMHLSFHCLVKLYVRIMQHLNHSECDVQYQSMMEVLKLVVVPTTCQHALMESFLKILIQSYRKFAV